MANPKDRVIFHVDCNGFYASVAELLQPELRTIPMAVCGDPESRHGVILAKNELAKPFNIITGEPIWQALQKCPQLILTPTHHDLYHVYCEKVNAVYLQYTDQVERFGIDESYMDVTGSLHLFGGNALTLAHQIRERVTAETGLTVSVGISYNKIFAKLGSDYKKPNAVTEITLENFKAIVWPLPVSDLLLVGKVTKESLVGMGVQTIGDLAQVEESFLTAKLGKAGYLLHQYANGEDDSPVLRVTEAPPLHSVGNGLTFKRNLVTKEDIRTAITFLTDSVAHRMRRNGLKCASIQVTIKDIHLKVITRQKPLTAATFLTADLVEAGMELVLASWKIGKPIRMLTITALQLIPADQALEQLSLFQSEGATAGRQKREQLEQAVECIRNKHGKSSVQVASVIKNDLGI